MAVCKSDERLYGYGRIAKTHKGISRVGEERDSGRKTGLTFGLCFSIRTRLRGCRIALCIALFLRGRLQRR